MSIQSERAILAVSFGTSYKDAREKNIDRIEEEIRRSFPERRVYRAWTSGMIRKKLRERDGIAIDDVGEALWRMKEDGIRRVTVQPTHVMNGIENEKMLKEILPFRDEFEEILVGAPLLATEKDSREAAEVLSREWKEIPKEEALVLMGHGTEHCANHVYAALDDMLKDMGSANIFVGTAEAHPSVDTLLRRVEAYRPVAVHLAPFMIVAGDHAKNDMSGDGEDSWASRFKSAGYPVVCHMKGLGEYPGIRKMFVRHAREAK
ncbi:MAG: sirohydrochlorin cobaltochelatase [Eubacteriales bacterium]|nr:sirohydrochlorin cobaltochelatase [Eubacteriales bacterium]